MKKAKQAVAGPREDVRAAIDRCWPDGVVEMGFDPNESYFWDVYPKLAAAIKRLKGAPLMREIEAESEPIWYDESDPDDDPPDELGRSRSYHLFFVAPKGETTSYDISLERPAEPDETGPLVTVNGTGVGGWSVGVSLLAPFAIINLSESETFEDGVTTDPMIEANAYTEKGERIDIEVHFREFRGEEAFQVLLDLRARISGVLGKYGITVLPEEEWRKPVPGLRADPEILLDVPGGSVRVIDALFFESL